MLSKYFDIDFKKIYVDPTPEALAEVFLNRIYRKLHVENFSFLISFYGRHRTGKSKGAVSFAYILDETFMPNIETRVVYSSKALLQAFRTIRDKRIKGAAIVVDEAGTGDLSSQNWYQEIAKIVSANLQAVGYLNPLVLFVTQNFSFINTTARKLSNGVFEVTRKNNRCSYIKPFWLKNNPWITGFHRRYPVFCEAHNGVIGNIYKINRIRISLPPRELEDKYDEISQRYKDQFLKDSEEDIEVSLQMKEQRKLFVTGIDAIVEEVYLNIGEYQRYMKEGKGIIDENIIRHEHSLSFRDAKLVKALVNKRLHKDIVQSDADVGVDEEKILD